MSFFILLVGSQEWRTVTGSLYNALVEHFFAFLRLPGPNINKQRTLLIVFQEPSTGFRVQGRVPQDDLTFHAFPT